METYRVSCKKIYCLQNRIDYINRLILLSSFAICSKKKSTFIKKRTAQF